MVKWVFNKKNIQQIRLFFLFDKDASKVNKSTKDVKFADTLQLKLS